MMVTVLEFPLQMHNDESFVIYFCNHNVEKKMTENDYFFLGALTTQTPSAEKLDDNSVRNNMGLFKIIGCAIDSGYQIRQFLSIL